MRLKTFHAATMAEAMRQIRASLGDDAIIVANRRSSQGGVEVTAAIEPDSLARPAAAPPKAAGASANAPAKTTSRSRANQAAAPSTAAAKSAAGAKSTAGAHSEAPKRSQTAVELAHALSYHGVPGRLTERLCITASSLGVASPEQALAHALDSAFGFRPLPLQPERPLLLLGPPGVGKTVTVAKLAARAVMSGLKVTVITCDTVRAGGVSQLAAITDLLKQPLLTIDKPAELSRAVAKASRQGAVLIDTAGCNPYDDRELIQLKQLVGAAGAEPVLVLAAGTDSAEAAEIAIAFAGTGTTRLLPTRLDVARRYGALLNAAAIAGLKFCDACTSPSIVKGLYPMSAATLARVFLRDPNGAHIESEFEEAAE